MQHYLQCNLPLTDYTYRTLLSIVCTFLHWKWCWNIPCTLYMEGSWGRVYDGFYDE